MSTFTQQSRGSQNNVTTTAGYASRDGASRATLQPKGNRPEDSAQLELQETLNESPVVQRQSQFKRSLDQSPQVQSLKQARQMLDQSPRVVAQAKLAAALNARKSTQPSQQALQRQEASEEEEPLQGKFAPIQKQENRTGLPDKLKAGTERLSGLSMDDVKVHYNSAQPAQLQAVAYTQGTEIHVGRGQERHLAHEAWHVVQQKQGRVRPTLQMKSGIAVNDDLLLEREADVMGAKALAQTSPHQLEGRAGAQAEVAQRATESSLASATGGKTDVVQRAVGFEYELDGTQILIDKPAKKKGLLDIFKKEEPEEKLVKGQSISTGFAGFDLSVDITPTGAYDVEIRIQEVSDTDPRAKDELMATVYQVVAVLEDLDSRVKPIRASEVGGPDNLLMYGNFDSGSLQATAGLSLTALYEFLSGSMGRVHEQRMEIAHARGLLAQDDPRATQAYYTRGYGQASGKILARAHEAIAQQYPMLSEGDKQELAAVITSIATIPIAARTLGPLDYAKSAATVLARSDYATIVGHLPQRIFSKITSADRLRFLIMTVINSYLFYEHLPQAHTNDPIYPPGSIKKANLSLTLGEWLTSLMPKFSGRPSDPGAKDLLTAKNYPRHQYPKDDVDQLESLGGFGSKTDLGVGQQSLPIFEFRRFLRVSLEHLPTVISGIWDLIYQANRIKRAK